MLIGQEVGFTGRVLLCPHLIAASHNSATDNLINSVPYTVSWRQDSWPPFVRILKHSFPVGGRERFVSTLKEHQAEREICNGSAAHVM